MSASERIEDQKVPDRRLMETAVGGEPTGFRRSAFTDEVASALTPRTLSHIMMEARHNELHNFLTLARDIEDRDSEYMSALRTRKLRVSELDFVLKAPNQTTPQTDAIMADITKIVEDPEFNGLVVGLMDALNASFAVSEILWDTSGDKFFPRSYVDVDQRFFKFDHETQTKLGFIDGSPDGAPLFPFKYVCHLPKYNSGPVWRSGLVRQAAALYMMKGFTQGDWMRFVEVFGMPIRHAEVPDTAQDDEIKQLKRELRDLGTDGSAVFKEGAKLFIHDVNRGGSGGSEDPFLRVIQWVGRMYAIMVNGQTLTTSESSRGTQSLGEVHERVALMLRNADARRLAATINRDLLKAFTVLNYGEQPEYVQLEFKTTAPPSIEILAQNLPPLVEMGFRIEERAVHELSGLPAPAEGSTNPLLLPSWMRGGEESQ